MNTIIDESAFNGAEQSTPIVIPHSVKFYELVSDDAVLASVPHFIEDGVVISNECLCKYGDLTVSKLEERFAGLKNAKITVVEPAIPSKVGATKETPILTRRDFEPYYSGGCLIIPEFYSSKNKEKTISEIAEKTTLHELDGKLHELASKENAFLGSKYLLDENFKFPSMDNSKSNEKFNEISNEDRY